jgi:cytochrome c-type biogenesis protein CcmE
MNLRPGYLLGFLVMIAGLVYLGSTVFKSSLQYYVTVDEFLAVPETYQNKTLKVAGKVKEGSIRKSSSETLVEFAMSGASGELPVRYQGLLPDTFKPGGDVVATGKMAADGIFQAQHILAKCASKYEARMEKAQ